MRGAYVFLAWLVLGCSSENDAGPGPGAGDDATDASSANEPGSESDGGESKDATVLHDGSGSSRDGSRDASRDGSRPEAGPPCTSPGTVSTSDPTPGACVNGAAVVCENGHFATHTCAAHEECKTYTVEERKYDRFNNGGWLKTRNYEWAGCVDRHATACELEFEGSVWKPKTYRPQCAGDAESSCQMPSLPAYPDTSQDGWQMRAGTEGGFVIVKPCGSGSVCRNSFDGNATRCFPRNAPICVGGGLPRCSANIRTECEVSFGFEANFDCASIGHVCRGGCNGAAQCVASNARTCDPNATRTCDSTTSYTACQNCLSVPQDCRTVDVFDSVSGTITRVPGQCAMVNGAPACVQQSSGTCDPATYVGTCEGTRATWCNGVVQRTDCARSGNVCGVANGRAGCMRANAPTCNPDGYAERCSGTDAVHCCGHDGMDDLERCVPDHEYRTDCARIPAGPNQANACRQMDPWMAMCTLP